MKRLISLAVGLLFASHASALDLEDICAPLPSTDQMWLYNADVKSIYDGDTFVVDIHVGLDMYLYKQKIRLAGINAWEIRGPTNRKGIAARNWMRHEVGNYDNKISIVTYYDKREKYGRLLALVLVGEYRKDGTLIMESARNLNCEIANTEHAWTQIWK